MGVIFLKPGGGGEWLFFCGEGKSNDPARGGTEVKAFAAE